MREATLERAAGCSALLGTDGLVVLESSDRVPIDVPMRYLEFVLVELGLEFDKIEGAVFCCLLEVEIVGCLLEVETVGVLLLFKLSNSELRLVVDWFLVVVRVLVLGW